MYMHAQSIPNGGLAGLAEDTVRTSFRASSPCERQTDGTLRISPDNAVSISNPMRESCQTQTVIQTQRGLHEQYSDNNQKRKKPSAPRA